MSEIRAATLSNAAGTGPIDFTGQWAARATASYNQTIPTVLLSENISSITDVATGRFESNFTNSFSVADGLSFSGGCMNTTGTGVIVLLGNTTSGAPTTSAYPLFSAQTNTVTQFDVDWTSPQFWGDLA